MKIFLAGATGFLGKSLTESLVRQGHEITLLVRSRSAENGIRDGVAILRGDPCLKGDWQRACASHEVVINLAGASIFQRWTEKAKKAIYESRMRSTENIVEAIRASKGEGVQFFSASGVGYYGYGDDSIIDEESPPGDTFLARLARRWEEAALRAQEAGVRVVLCRFGIVLGKWGGAFHRMVPLARFSVGAPWGRGTQWFSWIHEADVTAAFTFLLDRRGIAGPVNFTAPNPVTNRELMTALNEAFEKKPIVPAIPEWAFRVALGEFSHVFLEGQRAIPAVLLSNGFTFRFPFLKEAMADLAVGSRKA